MFQLYGFNGAASLAPHLLLEELRLPYEFVRLDAEKKEHKSADYLKLNPHGRVPTLRHGDAVLFESAAICLYLAEQVPNSGWLPPAGSMERGQVYKHLMFLTNTVQPALMQYFYPERFTTDASHAASIKLKAEQTASEHFRQMDSELSQRLFIAGDQRSVADVFALMLVRWGRWFAAPPAHLPNIQRWIDVMCASEGIQRAFAQENITSPYCLLPAAK